MVSQTHYRSNKLLSEILEDAEPDEQLLESVKRLKHKGYRLALDDFTLDPRWEIFLPYIDVIKFDFRLTSHEDIAAYIAQHKNSHVTYLAEKVETHQEFIAAQKNGLQPVSRILFQPSGDRATKDPLRQPDHCDAVAQRGEFAGT